MADNQTSVQAEVQSPVSVQEFAKRVKEKYPDYSDMDDLTLATKIVEKYPEYKDMVSFDQPDPSKTVASPVPSVSPQPEQPQTYMQKQLHETHPEIYQDEKQLQTTPITTPNQPVSAAESLHSRLPYVHIDENNQNNNQIIQSVPKTKEDVSFNPNAAPKVGQENKVQNVVPQQESPTEKYFETAKENTGGATIDSRQPEEYSKFSEHPIDNIGQHYEDFLKSAGHNTERFAAEIVKGINNYTRNPLYPGSYAGAAAGDAIIDSWQKSIPKDPDNAAASAGKIVPYVGLAIASILQPELAPATTAVWFASGTGEGLTHADEVDKQNEIQHKQDVKDGKATGKYQPMSELTRQAYGIGYGTANTAIAAATGHLLSLPVGSFMTKALLKNSPELIAGLEGTLKSFAEQTPSGVGKALNIGGQYLTGAAKSSAGMFAMTGGKLATNKALGENVGLKDVIDAAKESIVSGIGFESVLFPFGYVKQTNSTIRRREVQGTVAIGVPDGKPAEIYKSGDDYYQVSPKGITKKATEEDYNNAIIIPTDVFNKTIQTKTVSPTIQRDVYSGRTTDMLNRISDSKGNVHVVQDENGNSFYITGKDKEGNYSAVDTNGQTGKLPAESKIQTINKGDVYNAMMAKYDEPRPEQEQSQPQLPITTATVEGQQFTVRNPEDLGVDGKPVFGVDAEGNVKHLPDHKISDVVEQTPEELAKSQEQAKLMQGITDPNAQVIQDETDEQSGVRQIKFNNGQSKIITSEGEEHIANTPEEEAEILSKAVNGEPIEPKTEPSVSTEPKYPLDKDGKPDIDQMNDQQRFDFNTETFGHEAAIASVNKSIRIKGEKIDKLNKKLEKLEGSAETKALLEIKALKLEKAKQEEFLSKVSQNVNNENQNQENVSGNLQAQSVNQDVTNVENANSLQKNQLQNEKPLESSPTDLNQSGQNAGENQDTPQEKQGEGVSKGLEENVSPEAIVAAHKEIDGYIEQAQKAYDDAQGLRQKYIQDNGYPEGNNPVFDKLVKNKVDAEARLNKLIKAKENLLPLPAKLTEAQLKAAEKAKAKRNKNKAARFSPEEAKQRAMDRAKALSIEPSSLEQLILQHFASGHYRLDWDEIQKELFPRAPQEMKNRIWMLKKGGERIDRNLLNIADGTPFEEEAHSMNGIRNAVLEVIKKYPTLTDMVNGILEIGDQNDPENKQKDWEDRYAEAMQAQEIADQKEVEDFFINNLKVVDENISADELNNLFLQDYESGIKETPNNNPGVQGIDQEAGIGDRINSDRDSQEDGISASGKEESDRKAELTKLEHKLSETQKAYFSATNKHQKLQSELKNRPDLGSKGQADIFGNVAGNDQLDFGGNDLSEARKIVSKAKEEADKLAIRVNQLQKKIEEVKDKIRNQQDIDFESPVIPESENKEPEIEKPDARYASEEDWANWINSVPRSEVNFPDFLRALTSEWADSKTKLEYFFNGKSIGKFYSDLDQKEIRGWYNDWVDGKNNLPEASNQTPIIPEVKETPENNIRFRAEEKPIIEEIHRDQIKVNGQWYLDSVLGLNAGLTKPGEFVPSLMKYPFEKTDNETGFYNPAYISDKDWGNINKFLTKKGFAKRPTQDWVDYFTSRKNKELSHEDHLAAFESVFSKPEKPVKTDLQKFITKAKTYFGTTNDFREAGYLLQDGSMLDFSGRRHGNRYPNGRAEDHREIGYADENSDVDMVSFMADGNIRMKAESDGFELTQEPTKQQLNTLRAYIQTCQRSKNFQGMLVDYSKAGSYGTEFSTEYGKEVNPLRILNDILNYYRNGVKPVVSNDMRFRTEEQSKIVQDAMKFDNVDDFIDAYKDADFRDSHSAPGNSGSDLTIEERMDQGDDFNLSEVVQGFSTQPSDYFDQRNGARWYGYDDKEGMQSYYAIKSVMSDVNNQVSKDGKISKMPKIKAYRAVPKSIESSKLTDGDWITFSKEYAKGHGEHRFGKGEYKIISQDVPANEVWWDGNDINEWGYDTGKTEKLGRSDLKAIWENAQASKFRIIGEKGAASIDREEEVTTRLDNLKVAREMEVAGKDAKTIKLATGWEKGADGKWRYEVPDNLVPKRNVDQKKFDKAREAILKIDELNKAKDYDTDREQLIDDLEAFYKSAGVPYYTGDQGIHKALRTALSENKPELLPEPTLSDVIQSQSDRMVSKEALLEDVIDNEDMYKEYPFLRYVQVSFEKMDAKGSYNAGTETIRISDQLKGFDNEVKSTLSHEIQHAIQYYEGFAKGGNTETAPRVDMNALDEVRKQISSLKIDPYAIQNQISMKYKIDPETINKFEQWKKLKEQEDGILSKMKSPYDAYKSLAGEVESRNVQTRLNMTPEERRNSLLSETEDVSREDQIILMDGLGVSSLEESNSIQSAIDHLQGTDKSPKVVHFDTKENLIKILEEKGFSQNTINIVKKKNFGGVLIRGEIYMDSNNIQSPDKASVVWLHERTHIQTAEQMSPEELTKFYHSLGPKEVRRIIPQDYWNDSYQVQADEYISYAAEGFSTTGKLDDQIPEHAKKIITNIVNGFTTPKNLKDATRKTNSLDDIQSGNGRGNVYGSNNDGRGNQEDERNPEKGKDYESRSPRQANGGTGSEVDSDLRITVRNLTVSDLAKADLTKRHNASNAIAKISNDLSEPIKVVHSSELKGKNISKSRTIEDLKSDKKVFWHGSPSGDMRGGHYGLHIGTHEAAKQALEARIGVKADGSDWDGTEEYGKTLLAGKKTLAKPENQRKSTGYNAGRDVPEKDYYPKDRTTKAEYSDRSVVSETSRPNIKPFRIVGEMSNSPSSPHEDFKANGYMKAAITKGNAKRGYFYENVGEDSGSISAVVPNLSHVEEIQIKPESPAVFYNNNQLTVVSDQIKSVSDLVKSLVNEIAVKKGLREVFTQADPNSNIGRQLAKFDDLNPDLSKLKANSPEAEKLSQIIRKAFGLTQSQFSNGDLMGIVKDSEKHESNDIRFRVDQTLEDINKISSLPKTAKSGVPTLSEKIQKIKANKSAQDKINANRSSKPKLKDFVNEKEYKAAVADWKQNTKIQLTPEEREANLEASGNTLVKKPIKQIGKDLENEWLGNRDVNNAKSTLKAQEYQQAIKDSFVSPKKGGIAKTWQDVDEAIHLYSELGDDVHNDDAVGMDRRTDDQKYIIDIARNLNDKQKAIAEKIRTRYDELGQRALEHDAIRNVRENYVGHIWNRAGKFTPEEFYGKFATKTGHAKQRVFNTIIDGWDNDFTLRIKGATNNLNVIETEVNNAIEGKKLLEKGLHTYDENGQPLFTTKSGVPGYSKIEHYNFTKWRSAKVRKGTREESLETRVDQEGKRWVKKPVYAPDQVAKNLNSILEKEKSNNAFKTLQLFTGAVKQTILSFSAFHPINFMFNYYLTYPFHNLNELSISHSYKTGLEIAHEFKPLADGLVRNGMTVGRSQEWDELQSIQQTKLGKKLDEMKIASPVKKAILNAHKQYNNWIFNKLGVGLRFKHGIARLQQMVKDNPTVDINELQRAVGEQMNNLYGGINRDRKHRSKSVQSWMGVLEFAPDWTETNFANWAKLAHVEYSNASTGNGEGFFKAGSEGRKEYFKSGTTMPKWEHNMYIRMWGTLLLRAALVTTAVNLFMAFFNDPKHEEDYWQTVDRMLKESFKNPLRMNWLAANITPVHDVLFGNKNRQYYFNLLGPFMDAVKMLSDPFRFMKNKLSYPIQEIFNAWEGSNWQGKRYTTVSELTGTDDKGQYITSNKAKGYKAGEEKGGKHKFELTKYAAPGESGAIGYSEVPSFALDAIRGMLPLGANVSMSFAQGDMDGWQAMLSGIGIRTSSSKDTELDYAGQAKDLITKATTFKNAVKELGRDSTNESDLQLRQKLLNDTLLSRSANILNHYNWRLRKLKSNIETAVENNDEEMIKSLQDKIDSTNREIVDKFSNIKFPDSYEYSK